MFPSLEKLRPLPASPFSVARPAPSPLRSSKMFHPTRILRHAAAVAKEVAPSSYVHYTFCKKAGGTVAHQFDSLRAFATWHYRQHGWVMADNYPLARVANEATPSKEEVFEKYELCEDDIVVLF
jgi:hypothetical protein